MTINLVCMLGLHGHVHDVHRPRPQGVRPIPLYPHMRCMWWLGFSMCTSSACHAHIHLTLQLHSPRLLALSCLAAIPASSRPSACWRPAVQTSHFSSPGWTPPSSGEPLP